MIYKNGSDNFQIKSLDNMVDLSFTELGLVDYLEKIIHENKRLWSSELIADTINNMDIGDHTAQPVGRWI